MTPYFAALSLLFVAAASSWAGALPAEPVPAPAITATGGPGEYRSPSKDKWLRVGMIWGATALDLASTRYALANNPAVHESNPILAANDGSLRTGVYVGVSLPLDALATYANLKYPHSRSIRILTYVTSLAKIGIGIQNMKQASLR